MSGIILDTETTGFSRDDVVIELAIIDSRTGHVLFDSLIRPEPERKIHRAAEGVHGITSSALEDEMCFAEHYADICNVLYNKHEYVAAFNSPFDQRLLTQTKAASGIGGPEEFSGVKRKLLAHKASRGDKSSFALPPEHAGLPLHQPLWRDVLAEWKEYTAFVLDCGKGIMTTKMSLAEVSNACGAKVEPTHRALEDCLATLAVIEVLDDHYNEKGIVPLWKRGDAPLVYHGNH